MSATDPYGRGPLNGKQLDGRYLMEEQLATGGMGEVWRGVDQVLDREVAVKLLRTELAQDTTFKARFRSEARVAGGLSHGGIAAVYDYGEALGTAYLVMELVDGEPLSAMLAREGALDVDRTLDIVAQTARALHAAHLRGVVHRDIKPANLMVTPDLRVKVTDFGIARPMDHEPLTATGQVMGTAHYLAPELARGEVASPLSDIYALGIVAYESLAGWRPFEGDNQIAVATAQLQQQPPPLAETIPAPVRRLVSALLAKNPAQRPQSAGALAAACDDLRRQRAAARRTGASASTGTGFGATPGPPDTGRPSGRTAPPPPPPPPVVPTPSSRRSAGSDGGARRPVTSVMSTTSAPGPGRGGRRKLSTPLLALIGLVVLVVIGTIFSLTQRDSQGSGAPLPSDTIVATSGTLGTAPATTGPTEES